MPILNYDDEFSVNGVPDLLSSQGYNLAWSQYQESLIHKLNELTAGTGDEATAVKTLALKYARDPMNASLFNHASMAHNNQFFFSTLTTWAHTLEQQPQLQQSLVASFGSAESLRATMLDSAASMFGPGFTWLVWVRSVDQIQRKGNWKILNTYLAGTPYPEAGYRRQGLDMNNNNTDSYQDYMASDVTNHAGFFGAFSQSGRDQAKIPPGGTTLMPVLCVNTWQHVWIYDYGINGKRRFLNNWYNKVDWGVVEQNTPREALTQNQFAR